MIPVLTEAPYQFWALLGSILAAFLASRLPRAHAEPADVPRAAQA